MLGDIIDVPTVQPGFRHAFRNYVVHLDDRDRVRAGLAQRGIGTALSYAPPMHLQPVYAWKGFTAGSFPVTERSGKRLLGLPIGPHLDDSEVAEVADALRAVVQAT